MASALQTIEKIRAYFEGNPSNAKLRGIRDYVDSEGFMERLRRDRRAINDPEASAAFDAALTGLLRQCQEYEAKLLHKREAVIGSDLSWGVTLSIAAMFALAIPLSTTIGGAAVVGAGSIYTGSYFYGRYTAVRWQLVASICERLAEVRAAIAQMRDAAAAPA